jgi:hypothetical protein
MFASVFYNNGKMGQGFPLLRKKMKLGMVSKQIPFNNWPTVCTIRFSVIA